MLFTKSKIWRHISLASIGSVIAIMVGCSNLVSNTVKLATGFDPHIEQNFTEMYDSVVDISDSYEAMYVFCSNIRNKNNLDSFERSNSSVLSQKLLGAITKLSTAYHKLGHLITPETAESLHQFGCWANNLWSTGEKFCLQKLKGISEMDTWRNNLLFKIKNNTKQVTSVPSVIKLRFISDPALKPYNNPVCNIEQINQTKIVPLN